MLPIDGSRAEAAHRATDLFDRPCRAARTTTGQNASAPNTIVRLFVFDSEVDRLRKIEGTEEKCWSQGDSTHRRQ